ncbi:MAG TPA: TetR/AcrR family transcriptional regulator [Polyangiaceae bacterium]|nr:TetR/AcrR family transcriptional regulator [Polyangiaceae bacterium]
MPRPSTAPRKAPSQARSQATVEAILGATERLLVNEGYERLSTNRVAAAAGVSVGSLYQYFPSKEALVAALADRHRERMMAVLFERMAAFIDAPPERAAREIVRALFEADARERELHRVLTEQAPRIGKLKELMDSVDTCAATAVRAYLERHRAELGVENPALAAWLIAHAVESLVHAAVLGGAPAGEDELVEEVSELVVRYLRR